MDHSRFLTLAAIAAVFWLLHYINPLDYFHVPPFRELVRPRLLAFWGCGIFRNKRGVKPGRWGWFFYGFEFGSRNPGDPVGVFLKRVGLWPW